MTTPFATSPYSEPHMDQPSTLTYRIVIDLEVALNASITDSSLALMASELAQLARTRFPFLLGAASWGLGQGTLLREKGIALQRISDGPMYLEGRWQGLDLELILGEKLSLSLSEGEGHAEAWAEFARTADNLVVKVRSQNQDFFEGVVLKLDKRKGG